MTTSGTNTFNLTRNQLIDLALTDIGVKTFFRSSTAAEVQQANLYLNSMIKSWKNKGLNLWKSKQGTLFTNPGQAAYILDGTTANATQEYFTAQANANALLGATSIQVDVVVGFTIGDFLVIMQDDNTSLSTVITNIVGNIITFANPLTASVSILNYAFAFQTKIKRPEGISSLRLQLAPDNQIPTVIYSNDSYFNIPVKNIPGIPNSFYYNKQLNSGIIYLWPVPNVNTYFVHFTYQEQFDDFNTPLNTPDFPPEWLKPLRLGLAYELCRAYGKEPDETLKRDADEALADAEGYDREDTSFYIQPASEENIYTYR